MSNSFILQLESCDLVQFWPRYSPKTHTFHPHEYLLWNTFTVQVLMPFNWQLVLMAHSKITSSGFIEAPEDKWSFRFVQHLYYYHSIAYDYVCSRPFCTCVMYNQQSPFYYLTTLNRSYHQSENVCIFMVLQRLEKKCMC